MSSEQLADGVNPLDAELAATWDVLKGYSGRDTDLGIARRFGGSSAAYSLRDIGAMNGRVVKVRRDVDGDGTDKEEDFSANQVQSGALEDWVNGKLESTLPADVDTAAAAYSLRKVKADYSGDAVRIRRSSDDVEVDVAFDSDDKVSTSSSISVVSGSTSATTVAELISEERTTFITNPVMTTVSGDITVLSNTTSSTEFTFTFSGSTGDGFVRHDGKPDNLGADIGDTVSFDITASGLNQQCGIRARRTGANNDAISPGINNIDNGTQTITFTVTYNGPVGYFAFVNLGSASTGTIRVHNLKVVGKSAFVNTWYDQAGSNDAVQETADNQPKIASSGALLSGIYFDGTNDFLQTSTQVLTGTETGANSMYAVIKQTSGDGGYICGSAGTGGTGARVGQSLYSSDTDKVILTDGQDASTLVGDLITRIEGSNYLISVNYSNNNTDTLHSNSNANGYSNGGSAYAFSAGTKFTIGARDGNTSDAAVLFTGIMKEIIAYDSDQSDNRFKIESNINNYYGLYNDANEVTGDFIAVEGSGNSFTPNGTDGFILDIVTSTGYAGIQLNKKVTSGDDIFISFNADINRESTPASFNLALRKTGVNGSIASSQQVVPTQGFNSYTLTSNDSDAEYIAFGEGSDNVGIEVTDFKISRIARNGFVETLYDQSANLRDAIQGTATNQPAIVQNGGIVKVNSKPAITFDGNDNFLEVDGTGSAVAYSFSPSGDMGMFIVSKQFTGNVVDSRDAAGDGIFVQQATANTTRFRYNGDGSIDITATRDAQHFSTMTLDGTTLSASVDGGTASTDTVTAGVSTTSNLVLGKAFSGNNSNFIDGEIQEAIFYENNKTSEKSDIETDIDNFYSIT